MKSSRPKIARMTGDEFRDFNAEFPYRARIPMGEHGTDPERGLIERFFRSINSPVATSTNLVYLTTVSDLTLLKLGMYR
jgi:hypothetical protein